MLPRVASHGERRSARDVRTRSAFKINRPIPMRGAELLSQIWHPCRPVLVAQKGRIVPMEYPVQRLCAGYVRLRKRPHHIYEPVW